MSKEALQRSMSKMVDSPAGSDAKICPGKQMSCTEDYFISWPTSCTILRTLVQAPVHGILVNAKDLSLL